MGNHPIDGMLGTTMEKIKEMVDVDSVIGKPITTPDGTTRDSNFKSQLRICVRRFRLSGKISAGKRFLRRWRRRGYYHYSNCIFIYLQR